MAIRVLYAIFLGLLVAAFVGWGIAAYYPVPKYTGLEFPTHPSEPRQVELRDLSRAERQVRLKKYRAELKEYEAKKQAYDKAQKEHEQRWEVYSRNVAVMALTGAIIAMILGLGVLRGMPVVADGLVLGSVFMLLYSLGWSFVSGPKAGVLVAGVGVVLAIILGYLRFVRPPTPRASAPG